MKSRLGFNKLNNNKGTTLIEMIVSFTLLAIFVSASVVIISNVTNLYYHVRGENYARQVGDIVANKISAEISGAQYSLNSSEANLQIYTESELKAKYPDFTDSFSDNSNSVTLYDRTNTKVTIYASDGILNIFYHGFTDEKDTDNSREQLKWTFDKNMYNGYELEAMEFAYANTPQNEQLASKYGISGIDSSAYNGNVIAVYMKLKSGKYGEFTVCRYVKLYNYPDTY